MGHLSHLSILAESSLPQVAACERELFEPTGFQGGKSRKMKIFAKMSTERWLRIVLSLLSRKRGWSGHNGCALLTSCVSFQNFSLFLPPLTLVESLDWVVSDFSVLNAQRACYIGFHLFIFVDFWVVFAEIPSFIFVWKEDVKVVSLQGKTSLTKEDIATVFSLYDRVSCLTSCWVINLWMI